jgi:hypothetical protein
MFEVRFDRESGSQLELIWSDARHGGPHGTDARAAELLFSILDRHNAPYADADPKLRQRADPNPRQRADPNKPRQRAGARAVKARPAGVAVPPSAPAGGAKPGEARRRRKLHAPGATS